MILKTTPLHAEHVALQAKLVPFAGFEMPVQYPSGITAEHRAVRSVAGLFDVSHMGEIEISGDDALAFVQFVTTNDVSKLEVGQAQYSTLPDEEGKLLDDLIVYRMGDRYLLVVNASNREKDLGWLQRHASSFNVDLRDRSDEIALLALQGPRSESILSRLTGEKLGEIGYYRFRNGEVNGTPTLISRTGYTGEDGFELYVPADSAAALWRRLLEVGSSDGLVPAALGSRDSLRLEMGYALYGNDLDDQTTPLEGGLAWVTKLDKGEFIGRDALLKQKAAGVTRRLVGFRLLERGFPRQGYEIRFDGSRVGQVTSGIVSPSLGEGIGMGYVEPAASKAGTRIEIVIRGQGIPAEVVRPPFYTGGTVKR
ncbi:glycine cleavage system aminomethyltransferase GcvT [soil metagenome]